MLILGMDGGGTGCRAAIADASGRVLARAEGGPANIYTDPVASHAAIIATAGKAAAQCGADLDKLCAVLGVAGAKIPTAVAHMNSRLPFPHFRIVNDGVTATKGALGTDDGIVAAIGTGSIFAVQQQGKIREYGGHGMILGDEGGGGLLGRTLLAETLRAADGFCHPTPLTEALLAEYGGPAGIVNFAGSASPAAFAALVPRLMAALDQTPPDPIADTITRNATDQVRSILQHLYKTHAGGLPVVFLGGLGPFYAGRLAGVLTIRPARGTSLDGALTMARDLLQEVTA